VEVDIKNTMFHVQQNINSTHAPHIKTICVKIDLAFKHRSRQHRCSLNIQHVLRFSVYYIAGS